MIHTLPRGHKVPVSRRCATASFLLVLAAFVSTVGGCRNADDTAEKPIVTIQAVHPELGAISEEVAVDGTLSPIAQAAILAKITAPVEAFYVQRGAHVTAGQLLATLEHGDLAAAALDNEGAYLAAKGAYAAATQSTVPEELTRSRLEVAQAEATLNLDNSIAESRKELLARGAIPGRDYDTARTTALQARATYDLAVQHYQALQKGVNKASIDTAQGNLTSAKAKSLGANAQLSYTQIRTPISGVVTDRPLFPGETAAAGSPLITVMDTSSMIAKLHIAQSIAQQLRIGSAATIAVRGLEEPVKAKVSLVSPALDPGSTTVEVWLRAANPDGTLKVGTPVHATLKGRSVANALLIPTDALQRSPEGEGKIVMIIAPDGTAKRRNVMVGIQTAEFTQILHGLTPEDNVIANGGYGLDEGTKVKIGPAGAKEASTDGSNDAKAGGSQ